MGAPRIMSVNQWLACNESIRGVLAWQRQRTFCIQLLTGRGWAPLAPHCPRLTLGRVFRVTFSQLHSKLWWQFSSVRNVVTMHSEDVVDSADAQALTEEGKLRLWVLTQLHAFMHGPDDVCVCQEPVCDSAAGSRCDSECDTSTNCCVDRGQKANFIDLSVRSSCPSLRRNR